MGNVPMKASSLEEMYELLKIWPFSAEEAKKLQDAELFRVRRRELGLIEALCGRYETCAIVVRELCKGAIAFLVIGLAMAIYLQKNAPSPPPNWVGNVLLLVSIFFDASWLLIALAIKDLKKSNCHWQSASLEEYESGTLVPAPPPFDEEARRFCRELLQVGPISMHCRVKFAGTDPWIEVTEDEFGVWDAIYHW